MKNGRPKCKVAPSWAKLMAVVLMLALLANSGIIALAASEEEDTTQMLPSATQEIVTEKEIVSEETAQKEETASEEARSKTEREELDESLNSLILLLSTEDTVLELSKLNEEQKQKIEERWVENNFVFNSVDEMFQHYSAEGLSSDASNLLFTANTISSFRYVCENYSGDAAYLTAYAELMENCFCSLLELNEQGAGTDQISELYMSTYYAVREVEMEERNATGESKLMNMYDSYGAVCGKADSESFLYLISELQSHTNG